MRVISVDGKLQTTSSWGAEEDAARKQKLTIAQLKADIRLILEGRPDQQDEARSVPTVDHTQISSCTEDKLVFSGNSWSPGGSEQHQNRLKRKDSSLSGKTIIKPPALWIRYDQIPSSERLDLWHHKGSDGVISRANYLSGVVGLDPKRLFLRVERSVSISEQYDQTLYQHPNLGGWFAHDPQPNSVRPVETSLDISVITRNGCVFSEGIDGSVWSAGPYVNGKPNSLDIVAWKLRDSVN